MKQPVIYKITNVVNAKFYVGSTTNTRERFRTHRSRLRRGVHHCAHLQAAWNKYGEDCFKFAIVEFVVDIALLAAAEDVWLVKWVGQPECYNVGTRATAPWRGIAKELHPSFGVNKTAQHKADISKTLKNFYAKEGTVHPRAGVVLSESVRAQISRNRKGVMAGVEHYRFGTTLSKEVRKKIGDAQRGVKKAPRNLTPEGRAKIAAAAAAGRYANFTGKAHTDAAKAKMSKPVLVVAPDGQETAYKSLTDLRDTLRISLATSIRACKSGNPIRFGPHAGTKISYITPLPPTI
jgi:group I intron endonuclease